MNKRLPQDKIDQIQSLVSQGYTNRQIADLTNIPIGRAVYWRNTARAKECYKRYYQRHRAVVIQRVQNRQRIVKQVKIERLMSKAKELGLV